MLELHAGSGRTRLALRALPMGADWCILLDGGDRPHTGAVAMASPHATEDMPPLCLPGHREDALARDLAKSLSAALGCTVTVLCGIHIDDIRPEEIERILQLAQELAQELAREMGQKVTQRATNI